MEDKNKQPPESEQQWLKDLFDGAAEAPAPEETDAKQEFGAEEDAWLQELFASAELAAEMEFAPQPEETASDTETTEATPAEDPEIAAIMESIMLSQEEAETRPLPKPQTDPEPEEPAEQTDEDLPEEPAEPVAEPTKRRPKNKNSYGLFGLPHVVVTGVWLVIILLIGGFLGQWLWRGASDVLAFDRQEKVVTITITEDDTLDSVIDKLHAAGLINEPMWFRWYAQLTDMMEDIGVGTFELNTLYDYRALVSHMSPNSSARVTVKVVIPEGYTCAQIFALLEEKGVCSVEDMESACLSADLSEYWFLEGVSQDQKYCLEGYLFPDTYEFYVGEDANRVVATMLNNFDTRFTDIMVGKLEVLNETLARMMRKNGLSEEYIRSHQFTIRDVVIIASLIEKETAGASESYVISSVIYNKLTNPENYPCLELERPLIYITGHAFTEEDKLLDSPYNTFQNPGLIPTPICNPSRVSLDAALDPSATDYYFYAFNPESGSHRFFQTRSAWQEFVDALAEEETP